MQTVRVFLNHFFDVMSQKITKKPHKKLGKDAIVSAFVKNVRPVDYFKGLFPNDYRVRRMVFTVVDLELEGEKYFTVLKHADHPNKIFRCLTTTTKLEKAGPPNKFFFNAKQERINIVTGEEAGGDEDDEKEPTEDNALSDEEEDATEEWEWGKFLPSMTDDLRGITPKSDPYLVSGNVDLKTWCPSDFFNCFLPWKYVKESIIPATNRELLRHMKKPLTVGEFKVFFGLLLVMSMNPAYAMDEFFVGEVRQRTLYWNPPYLGDHMSGRRFRAIKNSLRLTMEEPPSYRDKMWMVRGLIDAYNSHMQSVFCPSWITCLDESMVVFTNEHCPSWVNVKRKPHPFGNEYHTIACAVSHILFRVELVETKKDRPKEGPYSEAEFAKDVGKTPSLCLRMTRGIWGSQRVVLLDSGFGFLNVIAELRKRGLYSTCVIKKRKYWPAGTKAEEIIQHMHDKDVGYHIVRCGQSKKFEGIDVWIGAMADSKHTSIMANTWSTTLQHGPMKKRRVGHDLIEIAYGEYQHWYYFGRHAVDDHNNNRQGSLSLEEAFCPDQWDLRLFGFIIALTQVNSLLAYNYFNRRAKGEECVNKATFTRQLAKELMRNDDSELAKELASDNAINTGQRKKLPKGAQYNSKKDKFDVGDHSLCRLETYRGKWDGKNFPKINSKYSRCKCTYRCGNETRTFCSCDYTLMLCSTCYGKHKIDSMGADE